ncbi:MAG: type I-F CRISPR-associated endoribonuclease Cas6/Csy4 [Spirobacillus cienkowskii]|uniref:Type I-F CRISPR-associated endoribonuclease Cas6/Csy4 n=1 Tax=Spirobacillus cienkowskii TaxID=495820 RepID=A0A369KXC2_9BACT|nr:MAG: type I-F CRISPR-associated endoribonuclease Cas6/Csy4 [Spirobacillus cienkowskii]
MFLDCYFEIKIFMLPDFKNNVDIRNIFKFFFNTINQSEGKIAVSFPNWNEKNIGNSIRFFANENDWGVLLFMRNAELLKNFSDRNLIEISNIDLVPDDVNTYYRFYRDRVTEKLSPNYLDRMKRRATRKNLPFDREKLKKSIESIVQKKDIHTIYLGNYTLFIARELAEIDFNSQEELKFSGYGLAPKGLGVPHF